jgi:alpha-L-rhamnosidase
MGVPKEQEARIIESLKRSIENRDGHLDTGIFGTQFFFEVLSDHGLHDLAYTAISKKTAPSYGWWVENGNTTFWEHWFTPGSGNHPMFGGGLTWFYRKLAGMQLDENSPGYRNIIFKPQIVPDLKQVRYSNLTPYGKAGIEWKNSPDGLEIKIQVPVGSTAQVYFPQNGEKDWLILEGGTEIPSNSEIISNLSKSDSYQVFSVKSGNYSFKSVKP